MMRCKKMFTVLALVTPFAVGAVMASPITTVSEAQAGRGNPNLCYSTVGACEYGPMDYAPELRSNVCWNGVSVTLMGPNGCGSAGLAYYLEHGLVVDPLSNLVLAIQPVIDTCDAGFCVPDQINPGEELIDGVACCNPKSGECKAPDENGVCNFGDITWCKKLENNGDGTVTCHE